MLSACRAPWLAETIAASRGFRQYTSMRIHGRSRAGDLTGVFLLAGALLLVSCHSSNAKRYRLEGRVLSVDKAAGMAEIDSKEIPGFMPAMTMQFAIPDAKEVEKLSGGDQITASLVVPNDGAASSHLEDITIVSKSR